MTTFDKDDAIPPIAREVAATSNTIEQIGYPSDISRAIAEYIWNGFDAEASDVNINFEIDQTLGYIKALSIEDNGSGIVYEDLDTTFRPILDSPKKELTTCFYTRGKRGKGRFSFLSFATQSIWKTRYKKDDGIFEYKIEIANSNKHKFVPSSPEISSAVHTGTEVIFQNFTEKITRELLEGEVFLNFLKSEFGWFLHLHKSSNFYLRINGVALDFESIIADSETQEVSIEEENGKAHKFSIHYILWNGKIGEDSQNYYLDSKNIPLYNEDNKTNKKGDGFVNSLYVVSDFFDNFEWLDKKPKKEQVAIFQVYKNNNYSEVFKELKKLLVEYLSDKKKQFLKSRGEELIRKLYHDGVMPAFGKGKYEEMKKADFEDVVKEIYIFEPQIFEKTTNKIQKQTILEFLKLLLDDDKRDFVVDAMKGILELDESQAKEFSEMLKKTRLSGIIKLSKLIIDRQETILMLKALVYDLAKFTNERDHIQKIIEQNYWLFGEQYHVVSADKRFSVLKKKYAEFCGADDKEGIDEIVTNDEDDRRPDIFLARTRDLPGHNQNHSVMEHIIVELKRPSQKIGRDQYRQIEDYLEYIKNDRELGSKLNSWKFYLVGLELESFITDKYAEFSDNDDPFLIARKSDVYRIYALKWSDLFRGFENSHKHILDELELDDEDLKARLGLLDIEGSRANSDEITSELLKI